MARRLIAISLALSLWAIGGLLLFVAAGFLFSTMVHHVGSDGWLTSALLAIALGVLGAVIGGMGAWLIASGRTAGPDEIEADDEAMWRD
ncbi:MAG: hypothetical protein ACXWW9_08095 [Actinomycetota bacterium]